MDDFNEILESATKSLPKYQEIEKMLSCVEKQKLPYELFKILKKEADVNMQNDLNIPEDGALFESMKQGMLECAGRTLVASTFFQEHSVDHVAVSAPGHSFLIIEQSEKTLIYFDVNNNLFFTFSRSALKGYEGISTSKECQLKEYAPRKTDFYDGINTTFSHFLAMPAKEAIDRQYLVNVAAALNGNKEFSKSNIQVDKDAAEAVFQIEKEIYGENFVAENFYSKMDNLFESQKLQEENDKRVINKILKEHPTRDEFINFLPTLLSGNAGNRVPYVKNASLEQKNFLQKNFGIYCKKKI
ncbi:hypothetical protein KAI65_02805 [Candidatus Parcubacteria bacterium]|nr:hypothetical protein [Candidatus Parcubacteria bacterium]